VKFDQNIEKAMIIYILFKNIIWLPTTVMTASTLRASTPCNNH